MLQKLHLFFCNVLREAFSKKLNFSGIYKIHKKFNQIFIYLIII